MEKQHLAKVLEVANSKSFYLSYRHFSTFQQFLLLQSF